MSCKVIRIGVFFDGTGNNLTNDEAGRSRNGVSNIGKLYRLYLDKEVLRGNKVTECLIYTRAIYIEGVGTINNDEDYATGGAAGTLGAQRINRAIEEVITIREQFSQSEYKCYIDVFGFSRGAAMAREFINSMYSPQTVILNFTFKFIGLFDTIGSFGLAGNDINYKPITDKDAETGTIKYEIAGITPPSGYYEPYNFNLSPHSAEKIVHFVALDEYRKNFPLTNTNGAGLTYGFIGAHSDVGGGYAKLEKEQIAAGFDRKLSIAENEKRLNASDNEIPIGTNWKCYTNISITNPQLPRCIGERLVFDDLQKVALIAMYRLALAQGVPFNPNIRSAYPDIPEPEIPNDHVAGEYPSGNVELNMQSLGWSDELQNYYLTATRKITELSQFLDEGEKRNNGMQGVVRVYRNIHHLKILAKYGHNSSGVSEDEIYKVAPFGFNARIYSGAEDIAKSPTNRDSQTGAPMRNVFGNNPNRAIIRV